MSFGRGISHRVFFKIHVKIFKYFLFLRKYCQLNRPISVEEKTGPDFRANDLHFCKYRQNSK